MYLEGFSSRRKRITLSKEQITNAFKKAVESMIPYSDGSCKAHNCFGLVIKNVIGRPYGIPVYDAPRCNLCGKIYLRLHPDDKRYRY